MGLIIKGELAKATMTWRQAHFGAVMSRSLQLPHTSSNRTRVEKEAIHSSLGVDTIEVKEFCLDDVQGPVHTTWRVTIPQFCTVSIHGNISIRGHCGFMCLQRQDQAPSCLHQQCQLQPMENYIQDPLGYPFVCEF